MELVAVQASLAARLLADPALAVFGAPFVYSPFNDEKEMREQQAARLRSTGVVIEVGYPSFQRTSDLTVRGIAGLATVEVFAAESIPLNHTPKDQDLVKAIATAIQIPGDPHEPSPEIASCESAVSEQGYVLHILTFTKSVLFR